MDPSALGASPPLSSAKQREVRGALNPSRTELVHLLQVWMLPERRNLPPRYDQKRVDRSAMTDRLALLAAPPGKGGIVEVFQDVRLHAAHLTAGASGEPLLRLQSGAEGAHVLVFDLA